MSAVVYKSLLKRYSAAVSNGEKMEILFANSRRKEVQRT